MASRKTPLKTEPKIGAAEAWPSPPWWTAPAVFLVLLLAYWPALNGPPLFDDQNLPVFMGDGPVGWVQLLKGVRPLYYLSLYLNFVLSGRESFSYHLTNLVLHYFTGCLVFYILWRLLELTGSGRREASWLALCGSLVFLLHPLQTEAVAYIAWMSGHEGSSGLKRNWRLHVPLAVGAVLGSVGLVLYISKQSGGTAGLSTGGTTWYGYLATQFKVIWIYVRLFILPVGQNLDYRMPHLKSLLDPLALLGLAGLIGLLYVAWRFRNRYPLASLGIVVFLILLSPTSSFIPIADAAAERRVYLPSIGLLMVLVEFLRRWRGAAWKNALIGIIILALAAGAWNRNHAFGSMVAMWEDATRDNSRNTRGWVQLSYAYAVAGRCADAVRASEQAEKQGWREQTFYWNFASVLECDKQIGRAIAAYRTAIAIAPQARAWTLLAALYERLGRWTDALDALDQAQKLDPAFFEVYSFRGAAYLYLGRYDEATASYRHALELQPNDGLSLIGLRNVAAALRSGRETGPFVKK